jgi:hypothetical protein
MAFAGGHRQRQLLAAALVTGATVQWIVFAQAPAPAPVRHGKIVSLTPQAAALTAAAAERYADHCRRRPRLRDMGTRIRRRPGDTRHDIVEFLATSR